MNSSHLPSMNSQYEPSFQNINQLLADQGIKVHIDQDSAHGIIEVGEKKFLVKLIDTEGEHPLDADTMTQVATRAAYMIFSQNLFDGKFNGAEIDAEGISFEDKKITHEESKTKEIYQEMSAIIQSRLNPTPLPETPAQDFDLGTNIEHSIPSSNLETASVASTQNKTKPLQSNPLEAKYTPQQLDAIHKYGANQVTVDGQFNQTKFESLEKAAAKKRKLQSQLDKTKLKSISNDKLLPKLNEAQLVLANYAKDFLLLEKAKDDLQAMRRLTPLPEAQIKATLATISSKEILVEQGLKKLNSLKKELSNYKLNKNKALLGQINNTLRDLQNLLEASNPHSACLAFTEKYKTKGDVQQGIGNAYTAAWSEKYAFRNPEYPEGLVVGHNNLMIRDPINKQSYQDLIELFNEAHQALKEASTLFQPLFVREDGLQGANHRIKPNTILSPEIAEAKKKLSEKLEALKQKAAHLEFKTNQENELPGVGNFGEFSKVTFDITLSKIQRELSEFDHLSQDAST